MDTLSSAKFRKAYPRLTTATAVTANGHVIGIWHPRKGDLSEHRSFLRDEVVRVVEPKPRRSAQAERDAILRRISKG